MTRTGDELFLNDEIYSHDLHRETEIDKTIIKIQLQYEITEITFCNRIREIEMTVKN